MRRGRSAGTALSVGAQALAAVPVVWAGMMLVVVFAVWLGWLPAQGFPRAGWQDPASRVPLAAAARAHDRHRRGRDAHAVRPQRHAAGRRPGLRPHGRREGPHAQRRPHPPRTAQRRPLGHHRARPAGRRHHRRRRRHRAALLPSGHRPDAGRRRQRARPAQGAGRAARAHRLRADRSGSSSTWCTGSSTPGSGRRHDRGRARGRTRGAEGRAAVALDMAAAPVGPVDRSLRPHRRRGRRDHGRHRPLLDAVRSAAGRDLQPLGAARAGRTSSAPTGRAATS